MLTLMIAVITLNGSLTSTALRDVIVKTAHDFRQAVGEAKPGDTIRISAGDYAGSFYFETVHGKSGKPIIIAAADPRNPPEFTGTLHFSEVSHLELRGLTFRGAKGNALNIDDGGTYETPSHHVTLRNLRILDSGSGGNQDGIKLSGVDHVQIEDCEVAGWSEGGSAIDMVGCHNGKIERCRFRRGGNGIQAKGGSASIVINKCRFEHCSSRGINLGGSTGMDYFRPPVKSMPPNEKYEAKGIIVMYCVFVGGGAPLAFVGVDAATVRHCTIYRPGRWVVRLLQETREPGFIPSRKCSFRENIVVFRSTSWSEGGVNIGSGTESTNLRFRQNFWYCEDRPDRSRPTLPTPEEGAFFYGVDPLFRNPEQGDFTLMPTSAAFGRGAYPDPVKK